MVTNRILDNLDKKQDELNLLAIQIKSSTLDLLESLRFSNPKLYNSEKAAYIRRLCNTWTDTLFSTEGE